MFQNINESAVNESAIENNQNENQKTKRKMDILSNVISLSNIPIYAVSLMLSMVGITGDFSPFSISLLGACISNSIPLLGVVVFSVVGNWIKFGMTRSIRIHINSTDNNSINVHNKTNNKRRTKE